MVDPTLNLRLRYQEKVHDVIDLIAHFGFASASNITLATGSSRRGFAKELHEKGILTCRTISGLIVAEKGVASIYGLTKSTAVDAAVKQVDIWKVSSSRAAHALILQAETVRAKRGLYPNPHIVLVDYKVELKTAGSSVRYDAVWYMRNMRTAETFSVAVEAERSGKKSGLELDLFFTKLLFAPSQSLVIFEAAGLMEDYLRHAQKYKAAGRIPHWKCTNGEWWQLQDPKLIASGRWARVGFRLAGTDFTVRLSDDLAIAIDVAALMGPLY